MVFIVFSSVFFFEGSVFDVCFFVWVVFSVVFPFMFLWFIHGLCMVVHDFDMVGRRRSQRTVKHIKTINTDVSYSLFMVLMWFICGLFMAFVMVGRRCSPRTVKNTKTRKY